MILFKEGKLSVPSVNRDFLSEHPELTKNIQDSFSLTNKDILVIVAADDEWRGYEASLTIAQHLGDIS
ncbi:MAG: DUF4443 domain-containing protein [Candidatus Bathyarchaeota archaeon]